MQRSREGKREREAKMTHLWGLRIGLGLKSTERETHTKREIRLVPIVNELQPAWQKKTLIYRLLKNMPWNDAWQGTISAWLQIVN